MSVCCISDLIVQAKSGTGKTCVFSAIALDSLVMENTTTQVTQITQFIIRDMHSFHMSRLNVISDICLLDSIFGQITGKSLT